MASPAGMLPDPTLLGLFAVGAVVMRSAGCIVNDWWDKDLDKLVERTKHRPLASGAITEKQAGLYLAGHLAVGLSILLQFNWFSVAVGASSLLLVGAYPLMKRVTYMPQAVLGLTFNWGVLLGWAASRGSLMPLEVVLPLYFAGACWTMVYDTIYAHQDKNDDEKCGIKSTALLFGDKTPEFLFGFTAGNWALLTAAGLAHSLAMPYFITTTAASGYMVQQIMSTKLNNRESCNEAFIKNSRIGAMVFAAIVMGNFFARPRASDSELLRTKKDEVDTAATILTVERQKAGKVTEI
eukprot:GDKI01040106.1.p1 GENE.GDKI01040106.1~~GDKI01040106.1.p1  ORF type:complete len:295 (-),score=50.22 GDKI01040106.1:37-921(-)